LNTIIVRCFAKMNRNRIMNEPGSGRLKRRTRDDFHYVDSKERKREVSSIEHEENMKRTIGRRKFLPILLIVLSPPIIFLTYYFSQSGERQQNILNFLSGSFSQRRSYIEQVTTSTSTSTDNTNDDNNKQQQQ
jgi:hypothetical protein